MYLRNANEEEINNPRKTNVIVWCIEAYLHPFRLLMKWFRVERFSQFSGPLEVLLLDDISDTNLLGKFEFIVFIKKTPIADWCVSKIEFPV